MSRDHCVRFISTCWWKTRLHLFFFSSTREEPLSLCDITKGQIGRLVRLRELFAWHQATKFAFSCFNNNNCARRLLITILTRHGCSASLCSPDSDICWHLCSLTHQINIPSPNVKVLSTFFKDARHTHIKTHTMRHTTTQMLRTSCLWAHTQPSTWPSLPTICFTQIVRTAGISLPSPCVGFFLPLPFFALANTQTVSHE